MVRNVQPARTLSPNRNEFAFEQHPEMLGYGGPAHIEAMRDVTRGALSLRYQTEDLSPGVVRQRSQLRIHG